MTPRQLLAFARGLLAGPDEAHWRSAVSRGYYAAFHDSGNFMRSLRFRVPADGSAHRYLSERFQNAGAPDWDYLGQRLERLRTYRTDADYNLNTSYGFTWAEEAFEIVDEVFDLLDQLRADPNLLNAVQAIRSHEQGRGAVTYFGP
jgi:hypothetical protein